MNAARKQRAAPEPAWVTLNAAAVLLGRTRHTVQSHALNGEIKTRMVNAKRLYSRASIDALLAAEAPEPAA